MPPAVMLRLSIAARWCCEFINANRLSLRALRGFGGACLVGVQTFADLIQKGTMAPFDRPSGDLEANLNMDGAGR